MRKVEKPVLQNQKNNVENCFYMATSFHVFIGILLLFVSLLRIVVNHFTSIYSFGFE